MSIRFILIFTFLIGSFDFLPLQQVFAQGKRGKSGKGKQIKKSGGQSKKSEVQASTDNRMTSLKLIQELLNRRNTSEISRKLGEISELLIKIEKKIKNGSLGNPKERDKLVSRVVNSFKDARMFQLSVKGSSKQMINPHLEKLLFYMGYKMVRESSARINLVKLPDFSGSRNGKTYDEAITGISELQNSIKRSEKLQDILYLGISTQSIHQYQEMQVSARATTIEGKYLSAINITAAIAAPEQATNYFFLQEMLEESIKNGELIDRYAKEMGDIEKELTPEKCDSYRKRFPESFSAFKDSDFLPFGKITIDPTTKKPQITFNFTLKLEEAAQDRINHPDEKVIISEEDLKIIDDFLKSLVSPPLVESIDDADPKDNELEEIQEMEKEGEDGEEVEEAKSEGDDSEDGSQGVSVKLSDMTEEKPNIATTARPEKGKARRKRMREEKRKERMERQKQYDEAQNREQQEVVSRKKALKAAIIQYISGQSSHNRKLILRIIGGKPIKKAEADNLLGLGLIDSKTHTPHKQNHGEYPIGAINNMKNVLMKQIEATIE